MIQRSIKRSNRYINTHAQDNIPMPQTNNHNDVQEAIVDAICKNAKEITARCVADVCSILDTEMRQANYAQKNPALVSSVLSLHHQVLHTLLLRALDFPPVVTSNT
jgi:hypothetical protein